MQDHRHMHLAKKECRIASKYLVIHDRQIASTRLTKQIIQKENILFHIHGTFKFIQNILFLTYVCISY
jgi:hypothetical protein